MTNLALAGSSMALGPDSMGKIGCDSCCGNGHLSLGSAGMSDFWLEVLLRMWRFYAICDVSLVPRPFVGGIATRIGGKRDGDSSPRPLIGLAIAGGFGAVAATEFFSLVVLALVSSGVSVEAAGWVLFAGSVIFVLPRLLAGWVMGKSGIAL